MQTSRQKCLQKLKRYNDPNDYLAMMPLDRGLLNSQDWEALKMTTDSPMSLEAICGFNIETKPAIDGKGWTFIANVHWLGCEKNSPRTLLTRVLRVPKQHRWRRSQTLENGSIVGKPVLKRVALLARINEASPLACIMFETCLILDSNPSFNEQR